MKTSNINGIYATIGWDFEPITVEIVNGVSKGIYPRKIELMYNKKYYPKGIKGEFPTDPTTGKYLEIDPRLKN